ncbi:MAG: B12-binding domain-containing radical SAM protein [Oscillospiraceae bacterium]|nr:B12-binding domain-containing radical SAM protein [Oscillospiraceae bacterium]
MSKKVLFVYPDFMEDMKHNRSFLGHYTEGLAALSASLKQAGHVVSLYHQTFFPTKDEFLNTVRSHSPDIIGFSVRTTIMPSVIEMAGWLDEAMPHIPVMCGGHHSTLAPESTLRYQGIDMACIGEGEAQTVALVNSLTDNGEYDTDIHGFYFRLPDGSIKKNPHAQFPIDLDALPFPDLDLFDFDKLTATHLNIGEVVVSRGCLYSCTYCSNANVRSAYPEKKGYARFRSPENAVQLLERLIKHRPNINTIAFKDAILNMFDPWFVEFIALYKERIGLKYTCNLHFNRMTEEMCDLLAETGCYKVTIGLENGNEEFRQKYLMRTMKNEQMIKVTRWLKKHNLRIITYNIVGLPHETLALSLETMKINAKLLSDNVVVSPFVPFPGTRLQEISEEAGFLKSEVNLKNKVHLVMPQYAKHEMLYARHAFYKLMRKYRKIYENNTPEIAEKKEARLDRKILSKYYPHGLMYRYYSATDRTFQWMKRTIRRFSPAMYGKLRDKKYAQGQ